MSWPRLLVLVRHAQSEGNVLKPEARAQFPKASWDYALTPLGVEQAQKTGQYVRERFGRFDRRYTSYYTRAFQTMQHLVHPEEKWYEEPRLAEAQRGIYHHNTSEQVEAGYPRELERKELEGLYHYRPPGGENWADVELRIHSFLGTLARDYSDERVLVVVHGHWQILFDRLIEHFSIQEALARYQNHVVENASCTIYEGSNRLTKRSYVVPWQEA